MTEEINIRKSDEATGGRYFVALNGDEAEMTYTTLSADLISVDHTFVPDSMRGKGVAQQLAFYAVSEARKNGWKIIPRCSFMHAQAKRHPDWSDVVIED